MGVYIYIFSIAWLKSSRFIVIIRYISRIFRILFSKLISIDIILLHTFSMGAKTRARLTQERTVCLRYAQLLSLSSSVYTREAHLRKIMGVTGSKGQRENVMCKIWPRLFCVCDGSNMPARAVGGAYRRRTVRSWVRESRTSFRSHRECTPEETVPIARSAHVRMRKSFWINPRCRVFHLSRFSMRFACVFIICYTAIFKYSLASNDHGQGQMISSSLAGRAACAGEDVTLTCAVLGTGRLAWVINSSANTILFNLAENSSLITQTDSTGHFTVSLIHYSRDQKISLLGNLTSTLYTRVSHTHFPITIFCDDGIEQKMLSVEIKIAGIAIT